MKLARHDPPAPTRETGAGIAHERGGAHPGPINCAAVALVGLKQYKEAATRSRSTRAIK